MAEKYKLTYFELKALGEPIRFILSYGGVDFEDIRIPSQDWPTIKNSTPFGKLPTLEVNGKIGYQSSAICRYLAKKFNLLGKDDWENLQIDAVVDTLMELRLQLTGYFFEEDEDQKLKKKETLLQDTLPFHLQRLDNIVKENGSYFTGQQLTWADIYFAAYQEFMEHVMEQNLLERYENLKSLTKKVLDLPAIKAWIKKRPDAGKI